MHTQQNHLCVCLHDDFLVDGCLMFMVIPMFSFSTLWNGMEVDIILSFVSSVVPTKRTIDMTGHPLRLARLNDYTDDAQWFNKNGS